MSIARFLVYLEPAEEGGCIVSAPAFPGCVTQGETREEALAMIQDATRGYILGPGVPIGPGWDMLLLRSMESPVEGLWPAVIDHALALSLVDYVGFRHLFHHSDGYELLWHKVRPLVVAMEETLTRLRQQLEPFISALESQ